MRPILQRKVATGETDSLGDISTGFGGRRQAHLREVGSGLIMRPILQRKIATDKTDSLEDISTLADPGVVDKLIREKLEAA